MHRHQTAAGGNQHAQQQQVKHQHKKNHMAMARPGRRCGRAAITDINGHAQNAKPSSTELIIEEPM